MKKTRHLVHALVASIAALVAIVVARHFIAPGVDLDAMTRGVAGPGTWPTVVLYGAAVCAVVIALRSAGAYFRGVHEQPEPLAVPPGHDDRRLAIGAGLIVAYGLLIEPIGMAWATMLFIAAWLVLGRLRRPVTVALVSVLGTIAILYLFVKISLMPLDRGKAGFEQATIALYQLLGIY